MSLDLALTLVGVTSSNNNESINRYLIFHLKTKKNNNLWNKTPPKKEELFLWVRG